MKSRTSLLGSLLIGILLLTCLIIILAGGLLLGAEQRAERMFGMPDTSLSPIRRIYLSLQLLMQEEILTQPVDPFGNARDFTIQIGETTSSVIDRLKKEGFILNANAFRTYLIYRGLDTTLQAGKHTLHPGMNIIEIALALQDATPTEVDFNILPGWRIEEVAQALPTSGLNISPESFLLAAREPPRSFAYTDTLPSGANLEGFIYPETYRFRRDVPLDEFVNTILVNFVAKLSPDLLEGFSRQGLDVYQAVTLASIVQREAVVDDEMPMIASVFFNRLAAGMKLDSDPTVQYALGYNGKQKTWWTNPLSSADLATDSLYNTYIYPGLPPGPIANPGLAALRAVAFPAQTPYYYFRAACDNSGRHNFSITYAEHVANACP